MGKYDSHYEPAYEEVSDGKYDELLHGELEYSDECDTEVLRAIDTTNKFTCT